MEDAYADLLDPRRGELEPPAELGLEDLILDGERGPEHVLLVAVFHQEVKCSVQACCKESWGQTDEGPVCFDNDVLQTIHFLTIRVLAPTYSIKEIKEVSSHTLPPMRQPSLDGTLIEESRNCNQACVKLCISSQRENIVSASTCKYWVLTSMIEVVQLQALFPENLRRWTSMGRALEGLHPMPQRRQRPWMLGFYAPRA